MESKHLTFRRVDCGVIGVGFLRDIGGQAMYSVAWPDRDAQKYMVDDIERNGVALVAETEEVKAKTLDDTIQEFDSLYLDKPEVGSSVLAVLMDSLTASEFGLQECTVKETSEIAFLITMPPGVDAVCQLAIAPESRELYITLGALIGKTYVDKPRKEWTAEDIRVANAKAAAMWSELTKGAPGSEPESAAEQTTESTDDGKPENNTFTEAQAIREYLKDNPGEKNKDVIAALRAKGIKVESSQVTEVKRELGGE